jgi:hypothetical protein
VKVWAKSGSAGDYTEMSLERNYKVGEEWRAQSLNIPNSPLADLIDKLQQGKTEFIDQQQPTPVRAR